MPTRSRQRWFRYSLRTLFVLVTAAAIGLGLWQRASALARLSEDHAEQARWFADSASMYQKWPHERANGDPKEHQLRAQHRLHKKWSKQYRAAIWRPWLNPSGTLPTPESYD
jgi:hypothetical protein